MVIQEVGEAVSRWYEIQVLILMFLFYFLSLMTKNYVLANKNLMCFLFRGHTVKYIV